MKKTFTIVSSILVGLAAIVSAGTQTASKISGVRQAGKSIEAKAAPKPAKKLAAPAVSKSALSREASSGLGRAFTGQPVVRQNFRKEARFAAPENMPDLYGCVTYQSASDFTAGLYRITQEGSTLVFPCSAANYGALALDNVLYTFDYPGFGGFYWIQIDAWDLETGENLASNQFGEMDNLCPGGAVQDPTTGKIYAITFNTGGDGYWLSQLDIDAQANVTTRRIAVLSGNWNSLACDASGQLYGISYTAQGSYPDVEVTSSTLCKLDKQTGAVTEIGVTGELPLYMSSATIDPASGRMFWNVNPPDDSSWMCEVDLLTGKATRLYQLPLDDSVMGLFVKAAPAADAAPAAVTDLEASFPNGSLSGKVSFKAPETLFDGTAAKGDLSYRIMLDGQQVASGTTQYGATVSADIEVEYAGQYIFMVYVSNETGDSPVAKVEVFIGNGVPKMTTPVLSYADGNMILKWDAVTESIDGGYIDSEAVTYTVKRMPDGKTVASNLTTTEFTEPISAGEGLSTYYYTVKAAFAGLNSDGVNSNPVTIGSIVPPYQNAFNVPSDLETFNIIDANGDGYSWTLEGGRAQMIYNKDLPMDDWLISPGLKLEGGKLYLVSLEAASNSSAYPEKFEVKWGPASSVEAMQHTLIDATVVSSPSFQTYEAYLAPVEDGVYYIGIHGISEPDMYYLNVRNFSVGAAQTSGTPAAVIDLTVTPGEGGELEATVSFTVPSVGITGLPIASVSSATLKRGGQLVKEFINPAVGEKLTYTDVLPAGGTYEYTVQAINADGEGPVATEYVFVGIGKPAAPEGITLKEEGNTGRVTISWLPVDKDAEGNPINPDKVKYTVLKYNGQDWEPFTEELTECSYTLQAVPVGQQGFVQFGVAAITDGGQTAGVSEYRPVGKPYTSIDETFADGRTHYLWGVSYISKNGTWEITKDEDWSNITSADGDEGFACFSGEQIDATAGMLSGKVNLAGMTKPGFSFRTYNIYSDTPDLNEIELYIRESSSNEWVTLRDAVVVDNLNPGKQGWQNVIVDLAEYAGKTVEFRMQPVVKTYMYVLIDCIRVDNHEAVELEARSISAPAFVQAGDSFDLYVDVMNNGMEAATDFTVELLADGEVIESQKVESLASGASMTVTFSAVMDVLAVDPVAYTAVVKCEQDGKDDNNTTESFNVEPKLSRLPAVDDLAASVEEDGVQLTWSEPDLTKAPGQQTEYDFEDGDAFAMEYAGWTFVDVDKSPVGGIGDIDLPGIEPGETTASFFIFDNSGDEFGTGFDAHSGNMFIASLFRYDDGTVDDWAISPELSGNAQTISFYAKSYSSQYSETIEFYYSLGSTDPSEFIQVGEAVEGLPRSWELYEFDVPAGAKHFAVRSCATASFILFMDDFKFEEAGSEPIDLSIIGYDVFRNGVKLSAEPTAECEYLDTQAVPETQYDYVVVTVYDAGFSGASNVASVGGGGVGSLGNGQIRIATGCGMLTVSGADGKNLSVAAADGKVMARKVATSVETMSLPAGVYVVTIDKKAVKVVVR